MTWRLVSWISWVVATLMAAGIIAVWMLVGGNRGLLPIGATTDAHHQIEMACETCHAAPAFASARIAERALNKTCRACHEKELKLAGDSHPRKKFRGPRMAVYREKLDARLCTACHKEHRPEMTRKSAVTVATDFCAACHSEGDQDIRKERPSHAGLTFESCATSGCHNYHDNRALYADFLVRHADRPRIAPVPVHALTARQRRRQPPAGSALAKEDAIAPASALADRGTVERWAASGHAAAGVNCGACHSAGAPKDAPQATILAKWVDKPGIESCMGCHGDEATTFAQGRHGMRGHPLIARPRDAARRLEAIGLGDALPETVIAWLADRAAPARMTVAEARLPMRADAAHRSLDCATCHRPHSVDIVRAAVEACASCHDDAHSRAYSSSPHHKLWLAERAGRSPPGTGVSCATCHMPRIERRKGIATNHNQNDNLRPSTKMIRSVCIDCHGPRFAIDALADTGLVARNFRGSPAVRVKSVDWSVQRAKRDRQ